MTSMFWLFSELSNDT